ncbi:transglutaminase-like domain-containing protein [Nocardiopsis sp. N85]|uniref:transglutaminase-like domain-containing protein n=1 Tax=Nocardiopsis sp. N85 TaxID=3029400 RepID=UPI00237F9F83|nr:transglutaminase-like domain-containing protein [Nocardiopsis sp. N85]MDE3722801.1 transglutaminase-like domain-containing protein [Nocardiopsis sp. N85]
MAGSMVGDRWVRQSPFSDPGGHGGSLPVGDVGRVGARVREMVVHYRGAGPVAVADAGVDLRWAEAILGAVGAGAPVVGCCRDFALLTVAALRAQGVAARTRVGFAGYLEPGFHTDHVVVEYRDGGRWVRCDTQFEPGSVAGVGLGDLPLDDPAVFVSASLVWAGYRAGRWDADAFGVSASLPLRGGWLVGDYVWLEAAHRCGWEVLLWDSWEVMGPWADAGRTDVMAAAVMAADAGEVGAQEALEVLWDRWRPRGRVWCASPSGFRGWVGLGSRGAPVRGVGC